MSRSENDDVYEDVLDLSRRQIYVSQQDAVASRGVIQRSPETNIVGEKTGCASEPCHNGADCYRDAIASRGYSCRCRVGFYGTFCDHGQS